MTIKHPWNRIHATGGYPSDELVPGFFEAVSLFRARGCRYVLDLGCGSGRHTLGLQLEGFDVIGMDIASAGLQRTRQKLDAGSLAVKLVLGDFRSPLPFPDGSLDAVFSTMVIHHARRSQVREAVAELWRVLAPDGLIFVSVSGRNDGEAGTFVEVEPGTIVPTEGQEAGVPHHIFSLEEAAELFGAFCNPDISLRAGGRVILIQAQKT